MAIYTRRGDTGTTNLLGRTRRFPKTQPIFSVLGSLDELNSHLGLAIALLQKTRNSKLETRNQLLEIQSTLFTLGTLLQQPPSSLKSQSPKKLTSSIKHLESQIDRLESQLPPLKNFLLPGGHPTAAQLHLARAVCRRVERTAIKLKPPSEILAYINRLSDYLFTLARWINHQFKQPETLLTPHSSSRSSPHKSAPLEN